MQASKIIEAIEVLQKALGERSKHLQITIEHNTVGLWVPETGEIMVDETDHVGNEAKDVAGLIE